MFGGNVPAGNPDKMTIDIIGDPGVALTRTLQGQDDYDFQQPPNDRLAELQNKYADQIKVYTPANTYYYFMNNRVAPFDNVKVRQAVNFAINREALVRIYGGLATPTENVLPPTYPQYKKLEPVPVQRREGESAHQGCRRDGRCRHGVDEQQHIAPRAGSRPVSPGRAQVDRLEREAEGDQRRGLLDDGRATRRRSRRSASRTGIRTIRIRSTGSTCC